MTLFTFENIETAPKRKLFTLLGVDYYGTPRAWLNLPLMDVLGIILAFLFAPDYPILTTILIGIGYGIIIVVSGMAHSIGHIISSRLVGGPMSYELVTATVNITHYDDATPQPSRVHIGRAIGGPAANLILGLIFALIYSSGLENHFILFTRNVNLILGVVTLLPIPSVDGSVILRELKDWKS